MEPNAEINRLLDLMPASGRMLTKVVSKPDQGDVINAELPFPWSSSRPIYINFDLWQRLPRSQRDMLLLRTVYWLLNVQWFKPGIEQFAVGGGLLASLFELSQRNSIGVIIAIAFSIGAVVKIWQNNDSQAAEIEADSSAIKMAQRRGYTATEAAESLISAIESVAKIKGKPRLSIDESIRCQKLRAIAGIF